MPCIRTISIPLAGGAVVIDIGLVHFKIEVPVPGGIVERQAAKQPQRIGSSGACPAYVNEHIEDVVLVGNGLNTARPVCRTHSVLIRTRSKYGGIVAMIIPYP